MFRLKSKYLEESFPEPEIFQSLDRILKWTNLVNNEKLNKIGYGIPPIRSRAKTSGPKVLLCHDYKYNYLERIVDNPKEYHPLNQEIQFYLFPYWSLIDIFVYFTHKILTVPPPEWITACHQNGVACFGTFLIEHWTCYKINNRQTLDGRRFLERILRDNKMLDNLIRALHNIQKIYQFDGWLINIETPVEPDLIERLEYFLRNLKTKANDSTTPSIDVIWYDSLINDGRLKWQNELNDSNKNFFKNSDAIFLNYTWNDTNLKKSAQTVAKNPDLNHSRYDIFVGVDCYGRGCYGGGGLQTWLAVQKILENDLSVAIFAPGWTHESLESSKIYGLKDEYRFWSPIACKGGLLKCERLISSLPLYTCFNIGRGFDFRLMGRPVPLSKPQSTISNLRWLNFEQLELQPSFFEPEQAKNDHHQLSITFNCPFNGGASFQIDIFDGRCTNIITLFKTRIVIDLPEASQFSHQIVFKHQKFGSSNQINKWIVENLRFNTIIDFETTGMDLKSKTGSFILSNGILKVLPDEKVNELSGSTNFIKQSMDHYETFKVNEWSAQKMKIDLARVLGCLNKNKKIILKKFQVQPYFLDEKNDIPTKFNQSNPLSVFLGEFYFDYFLQNHY